MKKSSIMLFTSSETSSASTKAIASSAEIGSLKSTVSLLLQLAKRKLLTTKNSTSFGFKILISILF